MSKPKEFGLNTLRSGAKSTAKRVGRGNGSGYGTTCGRGYKGQKSRSGGYHKVGFEGGQMPLQRRLPKVGFFSRSNRLSSELTLSALNKLSDGICDIKALRAAKIVSAQTTQVKVIACGRLERAVTIKGLKVSKGARAQIVAAGGKVE